MASGAVWGIDIGQCALKALRCRAHEDGDKVIAEAFDYIEYPRILSQPGAEPTILISDALKQFLSRNSVLGDQVAVSVSGQAGLARFVKLPPVEARKIPEMVRYEKTRQQIPFDLNDVVWDYQRMGGGSEEEGFALETEVGLFAMKREAVLRALEPFVRADIEVDVVQLTPEVLYNFLLFDQLGKLPSAEEYDPENPPESVVLISLGTDATDLVITNGYRIWQRSIPLGGNHFTKVLTKELKLTFAKAEHLKRNATAAADPKAVFQAMRPVFGDLLTELQRSIGYFSNLDRAAKIGRVLALGNAMKLPGLRRYLSQSLGFEIEKLESFRGLVGSQVTAAPSFQENLLSFPVAYGLALQGLSKGGVRTNLLPKEIIVDRLIKRKKPWAIAAAALLLLGCSISFAANSLALKLVDKDRWVTAETDADSFAKEAGALKAAKDQAQSAFDKTNKIGQSLVGNVEERVRWLELLTAVNQCLPRPDPAAAKLTDAAERMSQRGDLHIQSLDCQYLADVAPWYTANKENDTPSEGTAGATAGGESAGATGATTGGQATVAPPSGPGWIVTLVGYHYHNTGQRDVSAEYVQRTLIEPLRNGTVKLPVGDGGATEEVTTKEFGISSPFLTQAQRITSVIVEDPNATAAGGMPAGGGLLTGGGAAQRLAGMASPAGTADEKADAGVAGSESVPSSVLLHRFNFEVQFCWQPKTPTERQAAKKTKAQAVASASKP